MSNLYDQLPILMTLQELDAQIRELETKRRAFPLQQKKLQAQLDKRRSQQGSQKEVFTALQVRHGTMTTQLEANTEKVGTYRVQLMRVKTNREYDALDHEISHLENQNAALEDEILQLLIEIDEVKEEAAIVASELDKYEAAVRKRIAELKVAEQKFVARLEECRQQREASYQNPVLSDELRARYDNWFQRKGTSFVSTVATNSCGVCHITLRPQLVNLLHHRNDLLTCSSCGRVLYLLPPEEVEEDETAR